MKTLSRQEFLELFGAAIASSVFSGCALKEPKSTCFSSRIALQLYSIHKYIVGIKDKDGRIILPGVGLEKALEDVAAIGFEGVEFYGGGCFGHDPAFVRKALASSGLKPCGIHVSADSYGLNTKDWIYNHEILKKTCEFNMAYGNNLIINPGGGNMPPGVVGSMGRGGEPCRPSQAIDDFVKRLVEFYNRISADAAKMGCRIGLHNHTWEHAVFMLDGTSFWDYFFSNTDSCVCMEQDVGWSTCAGVDPKAQYLKYPRRSPTLHAKENGMGKGVVKFDAILGKPGCDKDGNPCATPVDWDALIPVTEKDGVEWYVVECERHFEDFSAALPSYNFLKSKGLN